MSAPRSSSSEERPRPNLTRTELHGATLAEVLLHGLSAGDENLAVGVLAGARADLETLTALACVADRDATIPVHLLANTLGGISRRLDVVLALLARRI